MKRLLSICTALMTALCTFAITYPKTSYEINNGILQKWTGPETEIDLTADSYLLNNLEEIGEYAFEGNTTLKSITLSSTVEYVSIYAFKNSTSLEKVVFAKNGSESSLIVDAGAFEGCSNLKSVTFSPYLKKVWDSFEGCSSLTNFYMDSSHPEWKASGGIIFSKDMSSLILFPAGRTGHYDMNENVVKICQNAFAYSSLSTIYLSSKLEQIDEDAFDCARNLTTVAFPGTLRTIGRFAFNNCQSLKSLILPNSIETIDEGAFRKCLSLPEKIKLPASLYDIDGSAFRECPTVKQFEVAAGSPYLSTIDGVLFNASKDNLIMWPWGRTDKHYDIPEGTVTIEENAFNMSNLETATFPSSLRMICEDAFYFSKLTKAILPDGVQNIDGAFPRCDNLTEIELPATLEALSDDTFRKMSSSTVKRKVTCYAESPVGKWRESDVKTDTLYVPAESIDLYKIAPGWRDFGTIKAIPQKQYFSITFDDPENGLLIVSCNGSEISSGTEVEEGSTLEISAVPFSDYELVSIEVNGSPVANNSKVTVTEPLNIVASFTRVIKSYVISIEEPSNGSLTVTKDGVRIFDGATVEENSSITIVAEPDEGYELEGLLVNGSFIENYATITVTGPVSISATFKQIVVEQEFAITFDEPDNGILIVALDGEEIESGTLAKENSLLTILAIPYTDYELVSLTVNGQPVSNNCSLPVTEAMNIVASFVPAGMVGVQSIVPDKTQLSVYTLSGQRLSKPRTGVNIVNGKKMLIKK